MSQLIAPIERVDTVVSRTEVARYYNTHQSLYSRFWSSHALHYGFWFPGTRNLDEAVLNTNRFIIDVLKIGSGDVVLDAGCGVGGTSTYIAESTGARVAGVTISPVQLKIARERRRRSPARNLLHFACQDYTQTAFPCDTFSKVFAVESVCHAHSKADFLVEACRIMAPGGRIAVIDAFLADENLSLADKRIYNKVCEGWALPNLCSISHFCALLVETGFSTPRFYNMQPYIRKSVRRIGRFGYLTAPLNYLRWSFGKAPRNEAAKYQKQMFEREIAIYSVFVAHKPTCQNPSFEAGEDHISRYPISALPVNDRLGNHE